MPTLREPITYGLFVLGGFLLGCGGGGTSSGADAGIDAQVIYDYCGPVFQTSCDLGQKCTFIVSSAMPLEGVTSCAAAGAVELGQLCSFDAAGVDDCQAGLWCVPAPGSDRDGLCHRICDIATATCAEPERCESPGDAFFSDAYDGVGVCVP